MRYQSYQGFYSNGPYARYLLQHSLVGSTTARLLHVSQPAGAFPDPPLPEFLIYLGLRGAKRLSFDWGYGRWEGAWHADDVSIAPPHTKTDIHVDEPHEFLALALPASFLLSTIDDIAPGGATSFGELHTSTFRNATVAGYCKQLWRQTSDCDSASDKLSTDCLVLALIAALARKAHGNLPIGSKLSGRPLARVLDFIDDRLADDLSLSELAAVADLSPMHFARLFRHSAGLSPHQHVLRCRMKRAQALLSLTRHRLADVALAVGFSSQAHMTTVFSRHLGVLTSTELGATDCCDPKSPFREGEGAADKAATCEDIAYWADRAPKTNARISLSIKGKLSAVTWTGVLAYLDMCDVPGMQVACVTYETNGMKAGEVVVFGGGYERRGAKQVIMDPCLASRD